MTLVQTEPKGIKIGATNIKKVMMRPGGVETQVRPKAIPYLCFTAGADNITITLTKAGTPSVTPTLETSPDGETWTDYTINGTITLTSTGDKVYWRSKSDTVMGFSKNQSNYYYYNISGSASVSGDIGYLLCKTSTTDISNFAGRTFVSLFNGTPITSAADLQLPITGLCDYCYQLMFAYCPSLTEAPKELPATTLKMGCYLNMFNHCGSLVTAPKIRATTLATECCKYMFRSCTSLTVLNSLPTETLASNCYYDMYASCSSIKLSATQTGDYTQEYRIPTTGTGTTATDALYLMFGSTGGTFAGTPGINTTYYVHKDNTII